MNDSLTAMIAEMNNDPTPIYKGFSRKQLNDAFSAVEDKTDWKAPILARLPYDYELVTLTVAAIEFFTATKPTVSRRSNKSGYVISSIGYRQGPAGDH